MAKDMSEVWDTPSRRITIEYFVHQQGWTVQGYIAESEPDADHREELFHNIVATIVHQPVEFPEPPQIEPEPTLPRAHLTPIYLDAETAVLVALEEAGHSSSLNNPWVQYQLERAYYTIHLFHLATAEVGSFNADTTDFLPWLVEYQLMGITSGGPEYFDRLHEHVWQQIQAAIHEPDSEIGQRIRLIESGLDPDFPGSGPEVYWMYLAGPYFESVRTLTPQARRSPPRLFRELVIEYRRLQVSDPGLQDFGAFLGSQNYLSTTRSHGVE